MYCANCGSEISENSKFCKNCGTPVIPQQAPAVNAQPSAPAADPATPAAAPAPAVGKKNKGSTSSLVTMIICIIVNVCNIIISVPVMCYTALLSFIAPFGMMIGAYYMDEYFMGFIALGISSLAAVMAVLGIVFSAVNRSRSKKGLKPKSLTCIPIIATVISFILNVICVVIISNFVF